jgi:hypothetical protein
MLLIVNKVSVLTQEPIAIMQFHPKEGTREGAELLLNQLAAFALVINVFLLPPVLFIEYRQIG